MDWGLALSTTATGLTVVFAVLILLVLIVWLFGKMMVSLTNKPKKVAKKETEEAITPVVESNRDLTQIETEEGISDEVVAAISAAVSVILSSEGKSYRLKSVKRARESRPVWSVAGIQENTRPF